MLALPYLIKSSTSHVVIISSEHSGVKQMTYRGNTPNPIKGTQFYPTGTEKTAIFPILGKSLPQKFESVFPTQPEDKYLAINVEEYDGHPDLDYFDIIEIDEDGMPIYAEGESEVKFYRKPYLYTGGENKDEKVYLNKSEIKEKWLNDSK